MEDAEIKCVVAFTLGYVMSDEESEDVYEDYDTIQFVIDKLRHVRSKSSLQFSVHKCLHNYRKIVRFVFYT